MKHSQPICKIFSLILFLLLCAGCGDPPATLHEQKKPEAVKMELLLNWYPEAEHGGYFSALAEGLYAAEGLDVDIQDGGPSAPVMQKVARGELVFGVANADDVVNAQAAAADVVALMAPLQINPRCIMVRADSNIMNFADLHDMTLAMSARPSFSHFLQKKYELKNVRVVPYPASIQPFITEKNFAQQAYSISEPYLAKLEGVATRVLMVSDTGFNPYASVLVARRKTIQEHPDWVAKLTRASIKGWAAYLAAPKLANFVINQRNPGMSIEILEFGAEKLKPLALTHDTRDSGLGTMQASRWQTLVEQMTEAGIVQPGSVEPARLYELNFSHP